MRQRLELALSIAVTLSSTVIAGAVAHRTWFASANAERARTPGAPPVRVDAWEELINVGIQSGPESAPITILEFGDFECPSCRRFETSLEELEMEFPGQISTVFVHFPLPNHRFASAAARAAECAHDQGRFVGIRRAMFRKQDSLGLKSWRSLAVEAGIPDPTAFESCLKETDPIRRVEQGLEWGEKLRIVGTPTIIINGWMYIYPPARAELRDVAARLIAGNDPFRRN